MNTKGHLGSKGVQRDILSGNPLTNSFVFILYKFYQGTPEKKKHHQNDKHTKRVDRE